MKQVIFITVLFCSFNILSIAQITPPILQGKIAGKKNLAAIMKQVEKFYNEEEQEKEKRLNANIKEGEEEFESELLFWKRWEYFNKTRLKPNGDLEDVTAKTIAAWQKVDSKYGEINRVESGSNPAWSFIGPFNLQHQAGLYRGLCRIDKVVFHPTDPNTIYAAANNGGLWRTNDGGITWVSLNFFFPIQSASGVVINPANPNNIFVLTGDGNAGGTVQNSCGIWVTNDGGGNWFKTSFNSNAQTNTFNGFKLMMMPGFSYILFAATQNGLYRSQDAGNTWTLVLQGVTLTDFTNPIYDIEFDPAQPGRVYASGFGRFYLSENFGASGSFTQQTSISNATRIEIAVSPAASPPNTNYVYLLCGPYTGGVGSNTFNGIYRSTTGGTTNSFVRRTNIPNILCWATNGVRNAANDGDQSSYDLAIDVSPFDAELVVTGGKNIWRSTSGGTGMQNMTVFNEDSGFVKYIHPDVHEIAFNKLNGWLYAGTDGGIYRSTDNGVTWSNITNGIHTTTFYHMAAAPFDVNRILGGTQDNGVKYKSGVGDFTHITGADGFDCAFGPSAASSIYSTVNSSIQKFDINGNSQAITQIANASFFPVIAADPSTNNILYYATGAQGIWKTLNGGSLWSLILNQPIQQSICTCPTNSNKVYVTGTNAIFRTDDGGTTWTTNLASNPGFVNNGQITDINVSSGNSTFVYVTLGGYVAGQKVMYSNNSGATWFNLSGSLPAEVKVNCVAVDQNNNAYIGTDMGVFYRGIGNSDWNAFYNQMPRVPVTDLVINQGASKIRASTYGHGIWETGLFTICDINFSLTGNIAGVQFYQASNFISSTANIVGGNLTNVTARAGGEVYLGPNFTAFEGNVFNAVIGPCETGLVPGSTANGRNSDIPPNFFSQVDKGNDTTIHRYGFITVTPSFKGNTSVTVNAAQSGDFLVLITNKYGVERFSEFTVNINAGESITKTLDHSDFAKGEYYVQLYFDGKLAHAQELWLL